jgi:hypothetical protein
MLLPGRSGRLWRSPGNAGDLKICVTYKLLILLGNFKVTNQMYNAGVLLKNNWHPLNITLYQLIFPDVADQIV